MARPAGRRGPQAEGAPRLFVAVDVPWPVRRAVAEAFGPWRERLSGPRWVPEENWHVTVKFLGRTWPRLVGWVQGQVEAVAAAFRPFRLRVRGVGAFPSPARARVLWAGVEDPEGALPAIAAALDDALAREFAPEDRPFSGHLTVARSDPPLRLPEEFAATALASEPFEVRALVLYRSHLRRPAPWYEPLQRFPLGG